MSQTLTKSEHTVFTENFKFPGAGRLIRFDAASYTAWVAQALPLVVGLKPLEPDKVLKKGIKVGGYYFYLRPLPAETLQYGFMFSSAKTMVRSSLPIYRRTTAANACFSDEVAIPVLCGCLLQPWMSLTPNEISTQRGSIRRARGDVGMAGLGLGWAARKVLERKSVKRLTVYEHDPDVVDFFGASLKTDFGDRVKFVVGDAYAAYWLQHDVALWDIWQGYGDASDDKVFWKIKRDMEAADKVCTGWGENIYGDH
jgi:hypothetical protein